MRALRISCQPPTHSNAYQTMDKSISDIHHKIDLKKLNNESFLFLKD